jgi:hypothetical protein
MMNPAVRITIKANLTKAALRRLGTPGDDLTLR